MKDALLRTSQRLHLDAGARMADGMRGRSIRVMVLHGTPARHARSLEAQLRWVRDHFVVLHPSELLEILDGRAEPPARPAVALTFDDGLASNAEIAAPILESLGMRGLFFVCPRFVETSGADALQFFTRRIRLYDDPATLAPDDYLPMTRLMLRDLRRRGHTIGNHTYSHQDLRQASGSSLEEEIVGARDVLGDWLGEAITTFAWTFAWNAINRDAWALVRASHRYCFTACPGRNAIGPTCVWRTNVEAGLPAHVYRFFYSGLADPVWWSRRRRLAALHAQLQR